MTVNAYQRREQVGWSGTSAYVRPKSLSFLLGIGRLPCSMRGLPVRMTLKEFTEMLPEAHRWLRQTGWHWFAYHFSTGPRPFAINIMDACACINRAAGGVGSTLLQELLSIGGRDRDESQYQQLMQKLAEILVVERIVASPWPDGTTFAHEPAAFPGGPRPELLVTFPEGRLLVEVKTPSLLGHARQRGTNATQLPYRGGLPPELANRHAPDNGVTLPRDNPIKDFLADAERKFAGFRDDVTSTLLVIVWDDHIYEPISSLANPMSGLLTPNSFVRDARGEAQTYPSVDAVMVIRHINYFVEAAAERMLADRESGMDFGDDRALPNVLFDVSGAHRLPAKISERLRAYPHDDSGLKQMAEYNVPDVIWWL